jgi:hypothetical protein
LGDTGNLYLHVIQHNERTWKGFTAPRGCERLLYFEGDDYIRKAITREKQLKGWRLRKEAQPHSQILLSGSVVEKLRAAWVNKHRRDPSTPRHKAFCYAIDLRSASLRMTTLFGGLHAAGWKCRSTKDRKSHRLSG